MAGEAPAESPRGLANLGFTAYVEARFTLVEEALSKKPSELLEATRSAAVRAGGWPVPTVLATGEYVPKPTADGIVAEIVSSVHTGSVYDYWTLRRSGQFFLLRNLLEDHSQPQQIFFDTRIELLTATFLFCARLYSRLGLGPATQVAVTVTHSGIANRILGASSPGQPLYEAQPAVENRIETEQAFPLSRIEADLVGLVRHFAEPLFELFGFFRLSDEVYTELVNKLTEKVRSGRQPLGTPRLQRACRSVITFQRHWLRTSLTPPTD